MLNSTLSHGNYSSFNKSPKSTFFSSPSKVSPKHNYYPLFIYNQNKKHINSEDISRAISITHFKDSDKTVSQFSKTLYESKSNKHKILKNKFLAENLDNTTEKIIKLKTSNKQITNFHNNQMVSTVASTVTKKNNNLKLWKKNFKNNSTNTNTEKNIIKKNNFELEIFNSPLNKEDILLKKELLRTVKKASIHPDSFFTFFKTHQSFDRQNPNSFPKIKENIRKETKKMKDIVDTLKRTQHDNDEYIKSLGAILKISLIKKNKKE